LVFSSELEHAVATIAIVVVDSAGGAIHLVCAIGIVHQRRLKRATCLGCCWRVDNTQCDVVVDCSDIANNDNSDNNINNHNSSSSDNSNGDNGSDKHTDTCDNDCCDIGCSVNKSHCADDICCAYRFVCDWSNGCFCCVCGQRFVCCCCCCCCCCFCCCSCCCGEHCVASGLVTTVVASVADDVGSQRADETV
jgi:hypothetical protein